MDVNIWDKCNNKCLMCTNPDWPWPAWDNSYDYSYKAIVKRLEKVKERIKSDDSIYLTGGEPTLHPRFLDILEYISYHFPKQKIKLLTNGRRFFYKDFAKKVLEISNNFDIDLSIYGPTGNVHDGITRTINSFEQTIKGLDNLLLYRGEGQIIGTRFVITKLSYKYIDQFLKLIKKRFPLIDKLTLIFWEVENQAIKNFQSVKVNYIQVRPYIEKARPLLKYFKEIRFYHFPLCTISGEFWPYIWRTLPTDEVAFVPLCKQCQYKKYCLGIHKGYLEKMGTQEFKPIKEDFIIQKTNNFHCPILQVNKK